MKELHRYVLQLEKRLVERLQLGTLSGLAPHLATGIRGEQEAMYFLRSSGYQVVAQRWSSGSVRGDLDLVAWFGTDVERTLVIVEVKTRTKRDFAPADLAVDAGKRKQLRRVTAAYLRHFPREVREDVPVRFDVVSVYLLPSGAEVEHACGAFGMSDREF